MSPEITPGGLPSPEDSKIAKIKSLYKKELLAGNFETAKNLDLSGISSEELKEIQEQVFIKKVAEIKIDYYYERNNVKPIRKLQEELGIADDVALREVRNLCIKDLENPVHVNADRENRNGRYLPRLGEHKLSEEKIPEQFGFKFSEEEKREFRESGFIKFLMSQTNRPGYIPNPELLGQKHNMTEVLKIYGLDEDFLRSEGVQKFLIDSLLGGLEKSDIRDPYSRAVYNINIFLGLDYFPTGLLDEPQNKNRIEQWFLTSVSSLKVQDGSLKIVESEKRKDWSNEDPRSIVRQLFELSSKLNIPDSIMSGPEVKAILSQYLDDYFYNSSKDQLRIDLNEIHRVGFSAKELEERAKIKFTGVLEDKETNHENIEALDDLQKNFNLSDEFLESEEVVKVTIPALEQYLASGKYREISDILDLIKLPKETLYSESFTELKQKIILGYLGTRWANKESISRFLDKLDFGNCPEFFSSEALRSSLSDFVTNRAEILVEKIKEDQYLIQNIEEKKGELESGYMFDGDRFRACSNFVQAREVASLLQNGQLINKVFYQVWSRILTNNKARVERITSAQRYMEKLGIVFGVDQTTISKLAAEALLNNFGEDIREDYGIKKFTPNVRELEKLKEQFKFTDEQLLELALRSLVHYMAESVKTPNNYDNNNESIANAIFKRFKFKPEVVQESALALYDLYISQGPGVWENKALEVKKRFNLDVDTARIEIARENALMEALKNGDLYSINRIKGQIQLSPSFLEQKEVKEPAFKLLLKTLRDGESDSAVEFAKEFLPQITVSDILIHEEPLKIKIDALGDRFPNIANKYLSSLDAFIFMYSDLKDGDLLEILDKNPFLEQALLGSDQYGAKLLLQYERFDKLSRNNIETLYSSRKKIIDEHPDIDPDSPEFRIAIQGHLADYRNNPEIISSLKKTGVNTDIWLNYSQEDDFDLGNETTKNLSEMIVTPIKRIEESLDKYKDVVKSVLSEYKDKLTEAKIPALNPAEIQNKIRDMKDLYDSAINSGDEKRATGIDKGIKNLESQLEKNKLISLWDKILGNLASFDLVKKDVFKVYDSILKLEDELLHPKEEDDASRRKATTANKLKLEKSVVSLKEKLVLLEKRVEEFKESLPGLLSHSLSPERADSLIQEIQEQVSENLDHYNIDKSTLANLLSDKEEDDDLVGRPMRVSIWSRNPDKDLYLGNYTNCCIRIDSEHLGSECAIADYATDLGMQIIAIYDEKKKIPIVVAWCWLGYDNDDNVALVIDNIEANTGYSSQYKQQLEERMKIYVDEFAKQANIPKVVQGPQNNDLTIASMDSKYFKLGGYNRASGYYLEGEDQGPWGEHGDGGDGGDDNFEEPDDE